MNKHNPNKPMLKGSAQLAITIAIAHGFTLAELQSSKRSKALSSARAAVSIGLTNHGLHIRGIARILNKSHASVHYHVNPSPSKLNRKIKRNENENKALGHSALFSDINITD